MTPLGNPSQYHVEFLSLQPMFPLTPFDLLEGLDAFRFFFNLIGPVFVHGYVEFHKHARYIYCKNRRIKIYLNDVAGLRVYGQFS